MPLSQYIVPVLAGGGFPAVVFIVLKWGPDAFVRVLAATVAVLTRDRERGERAYKVLCATLNRKDDDPPQSSPQATELPSSDDTALSA